MDRSRERTVPDRVLSPKWQVFFTIKSKVQLQIPGQSPGKFRGIFYWTVTHLNLCSVFYENITLKRSMNWPVPRQKRGCFEISWSGKEYLPLSTKIVSSKLAVDGIAYGGRLLFCVQLLVEWKFLSFSKSMTSFQLSLDTKNAVNISVQWVCRVTGYLHLNFRI